MTKFLPVATKALFESNLVAARILLAIAEWCWMVLLMWPGPTFDRPLYAGLNRVMPEEMWALVFAISGIIQLHIILTETFFSTFARNFAAFSAGLWAYVTISMLTAIYPPPVLGGEIAIALAAVWIWVRPYIIIGGLAHARTTTGLPDN